MKNKLLLMLLGIFLIGNVFALSCDGTQLGTFKQGETINLRQTCDTCTYVTLGSVTFPNSTITSFNVNMTKSGVDFSYQYLTGTSGVYYYTVYGDKGGTVLAETFCFGVGDQFGYWFIIIGTVLAVIFLFFSIVTPEEFFVYISGLFFLIEGIYIMINGFSLVNDANTRMFAFIYLGMGILFTVGAYVFNLYSDEEAKENKEEDEDTY